MKPSGMCLHIYSLPSSAFLMYQTRGFIVPEANLIPLLTFEHVHFAKFHFYHSVFLRNTGLGTDILFIKLELNCALASKKLEDLKVLRRSPDLLNNVKIGQGQLQLIMEQILFYQIWGLQTFWSSDLNNLIYNPSNSPVISEKQMFR